MPLDCFWWDFYIKDGSSFCHSSLKYKDHVIIYHCCLFLYTGRIIEEYKLHCQAFLILSVNKFTYKILYYWLSHVHYTFILIIIIIVENWTNNNSMFFQVLHSCAVTLGYISFNPTACRLMVKACRNQPLLYRSILSHIGRDPRISEEFISEFERALAVGLPCLRLANCFTW